MKKQKPVRDTEMRQTTREVEVTLSDREIADLGRRNAELDSQVSVLEAEFDAVKREHQGKLKTIETERMENSRRIRAGKEKRVLECQAEYDYRAASVRYFHEGRMIEERAMEPDEFQMDWTRLKPRGDQRLVAEGV